MAKTVRRISIRPEATLIFDVDEDGFKFVTELQPSKLDVVVDGRTYDIDEILELIKKVV